MRRLRGLVEGPYGRWLMLGLLIFILAIFTVNDEMTDAIRGWFGNEQRFDPTEAAGSFTILGGDRVNVSYTEFDVARRDYRSALTFFSSGSIDRVGDAEVWTYLMLLEAAKKEGVTVSMEEVVDELQQRVRPAIWDDRAQYKAWVRKNFGTTAQHLEEAIRKFMTTSRVRELYWESYLVGPPAAREEIVKLYASQNIEYVRGHVAALDAAGFLQQAASALDADKEPDKLLKEFFEKDPEVKNAENMFRHPRRYVFEVFYAIHKNLATDADVDRIIALFQKTFPGYDVAKLDATVEAMKEFYGFYQDRLLEQLGSSRKMVRDAVEEKKDGDPEKKDPPELPLTPEIRKAMFEYGFDLAKTQIARELKVRAMYHEFYRLAKDDKSLKEVYDHLRKSDDPDNPVLSTEPGKGLLVYRAFPKGLSGEELEQIEDSGVKFTHNYRARVTGIGDTDLPKLAPKPDVLGMAGHGRQITRVLEVKRETRKAFEELTPGEKKDLRDQYYLPARARERAREALQALRQRCIDDDVEPAAFLSAAETLGCRIHRDEWVEASYDFVAEPDRRLLWADQFVYMRDRYFLHSNLAGIFSRDRTKKELKAGSYLEVQVDARSDAEDPGAAYLFLLLERKQPGATSVPPSEINSFTSHFRRQRMSEARERWTDKVDQLLNDFNMEFYGDMKDRIEDELKRRNEASRRRAAR